MYSKKSKNLATKAWFHVSLGILNHVCVEITLLQTLLFSINIISFYVG
jgi:hypothetical protein